jgi:hypothetical protein
MGVRKVGQIANPYLTYSLRSEEQLDLIVLPAILFDKDGDVGEVV